MKIISFVIIISAFAFLSSCNNNEIQKKFKLDKSETYLLDTSSSFVNWERVVDNKKISKKVKLFGAMVDVNMENVSFTTTGNTPLISGYYKLLNDTFTEALVKMDFALTRFYSEEEEAFFTNKNYPPVLLTISNEKEGQKGSYQATLQILDSIKSIEIPATVNRDSLNNILINGKYLLQTLDWPIRENPNKENIRKDEISFDFSFLFKLSETKNDTIYY